jgi:hypothetical protein
MVLLPQIYRPMNSETIREQQCRLNTERTSSNKCLTMLTARSEHAKCFSTWRYFSQERSTRKDDSRNQGAAFTSALISSGTTTPGLLIKIRPARIALSMALSRWALRVTEVSSATLAASRAVSSSWTMDFLEARSYFDASVLR